MPVTSVKIDRSAPTRAEPLAYQIPVRLADNDCVIVVRPQPCFGCLQDSSWQLERVMQVVVRNTSLQIILVNRVYLMSQSLQRFVRLPNSSARSAVGIGRSVVNDKKSH